MVSKDFDQIIKEIKIADINAIHRKEAQSSTLQSLSEIKEKEIDLKKDSSTPKIEAKLENNEKEEPKNEIITEKEEKEEEPKEQQAKKKEKKE